ncbi:hypothetical protein BDZ45DRAFT_748463 [Acephala macrosclerotiorum]|nr:hypothetical protein BDZ45DRAFT_748463 [Acephala macrosclerotiorum]
MPLVSHCQKYLWICIQDANKGTVGSCPDDNQSNRRLKLIVFFVLCFLYPCPFASLQFLLGFLAQIPLNFSIVTKSNFAPNPSTESGPIWKRGIKTGHRTGPGSESHERDPECTVCYIGYPRS